MTTCTTASGSLWLRCHDRRNDLALFDLTTGSYTIVPGNARRDEPDVLSGWFARLGEGGLALYAHAGIVYLQARLLRIPFDTDVCIQVDGEARSRRLQIYRRGEKLTDRYYAVPQHAEIRGDPTPFVEKEDFDFGLFLYNFVTDPDRKAR